MGSLNGRPHGNGYAEWASREPRFNPAACAAWQLSSRAFALEQGAQSLTGSTYLKATRLFGMNPRKLIKDAVEKCLRV